MLRIGGKNGELFFHDCDSAIEGPGTDRGQRAGHGVAVDLEFPIVIVIRTSATSEDMTVRLISAVEGPHEDTLSFDDFESIDFKRCIIR